MHSSSSVILLSLALGVSVPDPKLPPFGAYYIHTGEMSGPLEQIESDLCQMWGGISGESECVPSVQLCVCVCMRVCVFVFATY